MADPRMRTLNSLCRVRKTQEDQAKSEFSAHIKKIRDLEDKIKNWEEEIKHEQSMSVHSLELHQAFLAWMPQMQENISQVRMRIDELTKELPPKREKVAQTGAARKAVEEVIEERQKEIAYALAQKEQKEIDDLAGRKSFYEK